MCEFEEYTEKDAREDMFNDGLEEYYYKHFDGERDWNELTLKEIQKWENQYKEYLFLQECDSDLESFYMTRGL
jgi:hypothetical protein